MTVRYEWEWVIVGYVCVLAVIGLAEMIRAWKEQQ